MWSFSLLMLLCAATVPSTSTKNELVVNKVTSGSPRRLLITTSKHPSKKPTKRPTKPTPKPTKRPSRKPTLRWTTYSPTRRPTSHPTLLPTVTPTHSPSHTPSHSPSHTPTHSPSHTPSSSPSHTPTHRPSHSPSQRPTPSPSLWVYEVTVGTVAGYLVGDRSTTLQRCTNAPAFSQLHCTNAVALLCYSGSNNGIADFDQPGFVGPTSLNGVAKVPFPTNIPVVYNGAQLWSSWTARTSFFNGSTPLTSLSVVYWTGCDASGQYSGNNCNDWSDSTLEASYVDTSGNIPIDYCFHALHIMCLCWA